jgi:hypothetical protein
VWICRKRNITTFLISLSVLFEMMSPCTVAAITATVSNIHYSQKHSNAVRSTQLSLLYTYLYNFWGNIWYVLRIFVNYKTPNSSLCHHKHHTQTRKYVRKHTCIMLQSVRNVAKYSDSVTNHNNRCIIFYFIYWPNFNCHISSLFIYFNRNI